MSFSERHVSLNIIDTENRQKLEGKGFGGLGEKVDGIKQKNKTKPKLIDTANMVIIRGRGGVVCGRIGINGDRR